MDRLPVFLSAVALAASFASRALALDVRVGMGGGLHLGSPDAELEAVVFKEGWNGSLTGVARGIDETHPAGLAPDPAKGLVLFEMSDRTGKWLDGRADVRTNADGRVSYAVTLEPVVDRNVEGVVLQLRLKASRMRGLGWTCGNAKGVFPAAYGGMDVHDGLAKSFSCADPAAKGEISLSFPSPVKVRIQDSRKWGDTMEVRFSQPVGRHALAAGEPLRFSCTIAHADGVSLSYEGPVLVGEGAEWIRMDYRKDIVEGSALDFSSFGLLDAPAGKYGWLRAVGGHFEFEGLPGVPQRFYGINLCGDANAPDETLARQVVTRLKRLGYNSIRVHHYEKPLLGGGRDALAFDPDALDRFDRLCALAIENGLYLTTDLFVSRPVAWRAIGFDREGDVPMNVFKALVALHEGAFENWKAFAKAFLGHVNPYTGRAYGDEPALPLVAFVNENWIGFVWDEVKTMAPCREAWRKWRDATCARDPALARTIPEDSASSGPSTTDASVQCFLAHVERRSARRQREFLRAIGCKALFSGQNCNDSQAMASARQAYDYVDTHFYVDHPVFLVKNWRLPSRCPNANPVMKGEPASIGFTRLAGMPFTVTEWSYSGPGRYRGIGGAMFGSFAALQDWDGVWRFDYSHTADGLREGRGFPGYFDIAGDPLSQAAERAGICLFLRGDLAPHARKVALAVGGPTIPPDNAAPPYLPEWTAEAWGFQVAKTTRKAVDGWLTQPLDGVPPSPPACAATGSAVRLDRVAGTFAFDTPRTSGGFSPCGALDAGTVAFDVGDVPATVWASSLDGKPLRESGRMLVTHLTDAQADGNLYADSSLTTILKWGTGTLVRNGKARVGLRLREPDDYEVWGLATDGSRVERLPVRVRNGMLGFVADVDSGRGARMLYEVVRRAAQWISGDGSGRVQR